VGIEKYNKRCNNISTETKHPYRLIYHYCAPSSTTLFDIAGHVVLSEYILPLLDRVTILQHNILLNIVQSQIRSSSLYYSYKNWRKHHNEYHMNSINKKNRNNNNNNNNNKKKCIIIIINNIIIII
jgi:hypothetical protein